MNAEELEIAILGEKDCEKEKTPLTQYSTFHPDMKKVEILIRGADIQKSFNGQPLGWVFQFCEGHWNEMLKLLFKYRYHGLHLSRSMDFEYLIRMLPHIEPETAQFIVEKLKSNHFVMSFKQMKYLCDDRNTKALKLFERVFA